MNLVFLQKQERKVYVKVYTYADRCMVRYLCEKFNYPCILENLSHKVILLIKNEAIKLCNTLVCAGGGGEGAGVGKKCHRESYFGKKVPRIFLMAPKKSREQHF